jgi:mitofilin
VGYVGGVWLSLKSDNFHDFFTEYVPYGEEAVLYLEEWDFRRRFPNATRNVNRRAAEAREEGHQVVIPSHSGLSWKASEEEKEGSDVTQRGKHMNAVDANKTQEKKRETPKPKPKAEPAPVEKKAAKEVETKLQDKPQPVAATTVKVEAVKKPALESPMVPLMSTVTVEPLTVDISADPTVKELARIVNDLITVSNAGDTGRQLAAPLEKAKAEFLRLADDIAKVRTEAKDHAQAEINNAHAEFDRVATELVQRIDQARANEAAQYREEFESEREKLAHSYEEKVKTELERANQVAQQRIRNELMEQAIELNRKFLADVRELVENERDGRLSKLSELQAAVSELDKLTGDWNTIVDANLKTQQLQVALDAVRTAVEDPEMPRPFLKELVVVKELADSDPVVVAAVASISPAAYQHGVPSPAQMVDRFRRVASEVRKASLLPENAGITSHIASVVLSKATFKKQISSRGDDVESILTRAENLLEEGNFDEAAREMNSLQGWARLLSKDWLADVRRVLEVRQALDVSSFKLLLSLIEMMLTCSPLAQVIEAEARLRCLQMA